MLALANDPEGAALSIDAINDGETTGSVSVAEDGTIDYDPNGQFEELVDDETATDPFEITVVDPHGGSVVATVSVTVTGINDAPTANDDAADTDEDNPTEGNILTNDSDIENQPLSVGTVNGAELPEDGPAVIDSEWGTLTVEADGSYTLEPDASLNALAEGDEVTDTVTYTITDGDTTSETATIAITITGTNDNPVAVNDEAEDNTTDEDTPLVVVPVANDIDPDLGDELTIVSFDAGSADSDISLQSPTEILVDPTAAYQQLDDGDQVTDVVTYELTDGNGGFDTGSLAVTINGVNDAPVVSEIANTTDEDTSVEINLLEAAAATDVDDEPVTVASVGGNEVDEDGLVFTSPAGSTITVSEDGEFIFVPAPAHSALDDGQSTVETIGYTVTDGDAVVETAIVITIEGSNDAPVTVADVENTDEDTPIDIAPLANDTDPDLSLIHI